MREPWEFAMDKDFEDDKWLRRRPVCAYCEQHIQEEYFFRINEEIICERCVKDAREYIEED